MHRGSHFLSLKASELYDRARERVQRFIGAAQATEVIFTSGTTAAINLVAHSYGNENVRSGDEILLTEMEHHSNIVPWQQLAQQTGATVRFLPITDDGLLDLAQLDDYLTNRTRIFAFTSVSNVLGTINPVKLLVEKAHQVGAITVVDGAQSVPHAVTNVQQSGTDFLAFSGHKMLGPSGIGVLYGRHELLAGMPPFLGGGSMIKTVTTSGFTPGELPARFEAGTPPIAQAHGLAVAMDYLEQVGLDSILAHEQHLATEAIEALSQIPGIRILGPGAPNPRAGIVSFVIEGVNSMDFATLIDLKGIAIRNGHHCAMPLHQRLGLAESNRASFYLYNTLDDVEHLVRTTRRTIDMLKA